MKTDQKRGNLFIGIFFWGCLGTGMGISLAEKMGGQLTAIIGGILGLALGVHVAIKKHQKGMGFEL